MATKKNIGAIYFIEIAILFLFSQNKWIKMHENYPIRLPSPTIKFNIGSAVLAYINTYKEIYEQLFYELQLFIIRTRVVLFKQAENDKQEILKNLLHGYVNWVIQ